MARWVLAFSLIVGGTAAICCAGNEVETGVGDSQKQGQKKVKGSDEVGDIPVEPVEKQNVSNETAPLPTLETPPLGKLAGARPISPRSLSLRIVFEGSGPAVFKPLRKGNGTAIYEVAYYRLATTLGVEGVPPSTIARFSLPRLAGHLRKNFPETAAALEDEARVNDSGMVTGALMAWVVELSSSGLDGASGRKKLKRLWAREGPDPVVEPVVIQASRMVTADYVLGNWDRFSGGNLFASGDGARLVLIDNNAAFAPWSQGQEERMNRSLETCFRFSKTLIGNLRRLDGSTVQLTMGPLRRNGNRNLLTDQEIERTLLRRDFLISRVDQLIVEHGRERVLSLP